MNMQKVMAGLCMFYSNTLLCIFLVDTQLHTLHVSCSLTQKVRPTYKSFWVAVCLPAGTSRKLTWRCCLNVMWSKQFNCLTFICVYENYVKAYRLLSHYNCFPHLKVLNTYIHWYKKKDF